ncbi:MAG: PEP-CTERM sorting domain-containing protein [Tepidisphaeraceae bacterium]
MQSDLLACEGKKMMNRLSKLLALGPAAVTLGALLIAGGARAGVINGYQTPAPNDPYQGGTAQINGGGSIQTPDPNNAGPGGAGGPSGNVVDIDKTFNSLLPIDITFHVADSPNPGPPVTPGYTSYLFDETVLNNTGFDWTDYHFQLGFGTGPTFALAAAPSELQFDPGNPAGNDVFLTGVQTEYTVDWTNGLVPNLTTDGFDVQVIVPDTALANAGAYADPAGGGYTFTLRQFPTVPEPTSFAGLGMALLVGMSRRRARLAKA